MPLTQFAPICLLCGYIMDMIGERTAEAARRMEDRRRRKMHPRKRNDRAIEYECTRRENKGEHYVKK